MSEPTLPDLTHRLDRLERENRWLKRGGLVALVVLAGAFMMGQAAPEKIPLVLKAHSFQVVDQAGKLRARLGVGADGAPRLLLYDKAGKLRGMLGVRPNGASHLFFSGPDGKLRAGLVVIDGVPRLDLHDETGEIRARLSLRADGSPSLLLFDNGGNIRAALGHVEVEARRTGTVEQRDASSVVLFDTGGKVIWKAP